MKELIPLESVNAVELFTTPDHLDNLLKTIEDSVIGIVHDVSEPTGRKDIASVAYNIARSKTTIDEAGKELGSDYLRKKQAIDSGRRRSREFLDDLKAKVRRPLTDWEDEQERQAEAVRVQAEIDEDHRSAWAENALIDRQIELDRQAKELFAKEKQRRAAGKKVNESSKEDFRELSMLFG